ncbi:RHS repeat-associated core domain-containing protein, partial [Chryseobacterium sp.]|uniref:RHS repeat domain-containing protein n=1 Tax=Chryseobacterium sp. TaxID=1871047 RepID=UPI0025C206FF
DGEGKFTKFYSEDGSYEIVKDNTTGKEKHIIYIGGSPYESNIVYLKNYTESSGSYKFLHKDYLGSILAISDEAGNKLEQRHFDAWGNLTHLQIGNGAIITDRQQLATSCLLIDRGYTSHEHFGEIGIIHMNGRLYDPLLRRFLNADEFIQDPYNTQNYNKYGYVMNNPLLYNDPTGEIMGWDDALIAIGIAIFTSVATDYYLNQPISFGNMFQSVVMSLASAGISSAIGDVFLAGTKVAESLGKTGTIIAKAGAHAIAQGTLSYVQGGNFLSGALSGAFASVSNDLLGLALNNVGDNSILKSDAFALFNGAVSGGVGSVLGGGNFWAGAGQGLIVTAFNYLAHQVNAIDGDDPKQKTPGNKYGTLEEYRAWRDYSGYHKGETKMDRIFRLMNSSHIEIMGDEGAGGGMMYGSGGGRGAVAKDITSRLQRHVTEAAAEVDRLGDGAFTPKQVRAIQRNPNLRAAFRGNRIDVKARDAIEKDPALQHLKSNYSKGPDFVDPKTGKWWDMTTPAQWQKHVNKYGAGGTLLRTR